jgi:chromosome segregation ATPase
MTVEEINAKYSQACAECGDLLLKLLDKQDQRNVLDQEIGALHQKIEAYRKVRDDLQKALNSASPEAAKVD